MEFLTPVVAVPKRGGETRECLVADTAGLLARNLNDPVPSLFGNLLRAFRNIKFEAEN